LHTCQKAGFVRHPETWRDYTVATQKAKREFRVHSLNLAGFVRRKGRLKTMKRCVILLSVFLLMSMIAIAAGPKTYQVTGPVLDIKGDVITVQKGADKWEIALDKSTKTTGDLKVGSKVTIEYQMTATSIVVKPAATAKPAEPSKKKK